MKCAECEACNHDLCTIGIYSYMLKKSKQRGCALNHPQVYYRMKQNAPTGRDIINQMDDETFLNMFEGAICDYVQDNDKKWCREQEKCTGCIEKWLKEKHLKDS